MDSANGRAELCHSTLTSKNVKNFSSALNVDGNYLNPSWIIGLADYARGKYESNAKEGRISETLGTNLRATCRRKLTLRNWPIDVEPDPGTWVFWLPDGWAQGIRTQASSGKTLKCYMSPAGKRYWHKKDIERDLGFALPTAHSSRDFWCPLLPYVWRRKADKPIESFLLPARGMQTLGDPAPQLQMPMAAYQFHLASYSKEELADMLENAAPTYYEE